MLEGMILYGVFTTIVSITVFFLAVTDEKRRYMYYGCPKYIYNNSTLNVFGVLVTFLLYFIFIPVYYILWFGYWLLHVGRKVGKNDAE